MGTGIASALKTDAGTDVENPRGNPRGIPRFIVGNPMNIDDFPIQMGVSMNGGTPIAGWLAKGIILLKWMIWGVPLFQETTI